MGKRSDFTRIDKDFYRTIDKRAGDILCPYLSMIDGAYKDGKVRYSEPCYGQGDLSDQLFAYGHIPMQASDIADPSPINQKDALTLVARDVVNCDVIITNPPWSRPILHKMITHFSSLKPTWLLFDSDWCHTVQSASYMKDLCTHMVSVGRLKWIPGTTMSGKDNCSWYRFDINKTKETIFYGRN